ncbi:hypothetical protein VVS03_03225 [Corynebacterium sp. LK2537]|uniref:hypothetical protein n=1 Tax=Corynebacterium sp. LK2537 TaxID=3110471 RepID=UPI0034CD8B84
MQKSAIRTLAALTAAGLVVTGCSRPDDSTESQPSEAAHTEAADAHSDHEHHHDGVEAAAGQEEVAQLPGRILLSTDDELISLDAKSGEEIGHAEASGFKRLNPAGDGRHALVTRGDKFQAFDMGLIRQAHGDHFHYFTQDPALSDATFAGLPHAGHVVSHDGYTALFSDGDGKAQIYKTKDMVADGAAAEPVNTVETGAPHHGVAVPLKDGSVVVTQGTEDERHTIQHLDADGKKLAETTECPGVHGEAAAQNGNIVFGCEDGPVVFDGSDFHKVDVSAFAGKSGYQRSGNAAGSEESNIILADNKTDADAEHERPTSVALIDAEDNSARTVELDGSYWFRSLARGPLDEGLVLTTDGKLNVIDPDSAEVTDSIEAISPWTENEEWQAPGPILKAANGYAYVTDANQKELVIIDLFKKEVVKRVELETPVTEMEVF